MTDTLFDKWDNEGSGYLELNHVESVMSTYKGGSEIDAIKKAKFNLKSRISDEKLSKREFRYFVQDITNNISGQFEYEYFIDYLTDSVELSQLERVRGNARKMWLNSIVNAGKTNGTHLSPVFNKVFSTLCKDAEIHGGGKKISAYIALLVTNHKDPKERGENFLHYMAATPDHAEFVKGKILYRDMKGVSFLCVDKGIPVYVPKVKTHGNIHFWNQSNWKTENQGSFLVIPLKDQGKRVFGVLGIDTTNDSHEKTVFLTHEINFYQGVAKVFSIAYHQVEHQDILLKKLSVTTPKGNTIRFAKPSCLKRKDSLFRDYLFRCVDNSETVSADAYGQHRLAFPLRDKEGMVSFVVDISIGSTLKQLPNYENRELLRMLRLLQVAHREITNELKEGESCKMVLAAEQLTDNLRVEVMFDRLLLLDLRDNVSKLDMQAFAELRSYTAPPPVIREVLKAVLSVFYQKESEEGLFDDWTVTRNYINQQLCQKIAQYDPTALDDLIEVEKMEEKLKDIPHGEVAKHGSVPTEHLFNWLFVCISLIEHLKNKDTDMS
ncbi:unnamed protein product [Acanthosepion pharaonis]|uniref:EF-hand domain-containing protein n=1 Tax=Acanthosepion pharaonis TaxID=158019 RepID=A0A812E0M7_ACAPH|nr:unnamed protein product [Sepia pharaonis]